MKIFFISISFFLVSEGVLAEGMTDEALDYEVWCALAKAFKKKSDKEPTARIVGLSKQIEKRTISQAAKNVFEGIDAVAPHDRRKVFQIHAKKAGLVDFKCPALRQFFDPENHK